MSAGFAEAGPTGRVLQDELVRKVRANGMRLVGPNCLGLLNTDPAIRLNATFGSIFPPLGRVAISSQSGALGLAILDYAQQFGLGISTFVSVGNKADVSGNDLLQYWEEDPTTDLIILYLESFGNPRKFARIARRIARRKPILAVKSGRTPAGSRAALVHTAAVAGSDRAVEALFRQAGVIRADTLEQLFDVAAVLTHQPLLSRMLEVRVSSVPTPVRPKDWSCPLWLQPRSSLCGSCCLWVDSQKIRSISWLTHGRSSTRAPYN
jgi:acyl-CoA synthetase (NDP forming)